MDREEAWINFKNKFSIGQSVSGKIIHKAPYGVFLDIGEDFLCLLEIIEINDLNYELYTADQIFKAGEIVEGKVGDFTDSNKQMRITQRDRKNEN